MKASSSTGRAAGPAAAGIRPLATLSVGLYLLVLAAIIFLYLRAIFQLLPYQERILGGLQMILPRLLPQFSLPSVLMLVVLLGVGLWRMRDLARVVAAVPRGIRGVATMIPLYLLLANDKRLVAVLVVVAAFGWVLYGPLSRLLAPRLAALPPLVGVPLARFWSAILFTALLSQNVLATLGATAVMWLYHYADLAMQLAFQPVWMWHWSLPRRTFLGIYLGRMVIAGTAPILLSYSFAWFNWGFDQNIFFYGVLVAAMCYFVGRVPPPLETAGS